MPLVVVRVVRGSPNFRITSEVLREFKNGISGGALVGSCPTKSIATSGSASLEFRREKYKVMTPFMARVDGVVDPGRVVAADGLTFCLKHLIRGHVQPKPAERLQGWSQSRQRDAIHTRVAGVARHSWLATKRRILRGR